MRLLLALLAHQTAGYAIGGRLPGAALRLRMQADMGGAAVALQEVDVWAGDSPLILDVNWRVMPNERWALVGVNGCGKSTLLRAIEASARGEKLADGVVQVSQRLRVGMLEQTAVSGSGATVREEVMSRMGTYQSAKTALEAAQEMCTTGSGAEVEALELAQASFEAAGGYDVDARVARVLKGLGFADAEFDRPCSSFSGGWQMRVGLARLLLSEPEILMLDEPTNHLDAAARTWLGKYVSEYRGTVLVVSHDEAFIGAAADSIAEVAGGRLNTYKSVTHAKFLQEREERQARAVATVEAQEREAKRLQDFIDRMGAKASKARQAKDRQGKLDKLEEKMLATRQLVLSKTRTPKLSLATPPASGSPLLALRNADLRHPRGSRDILSAAELTVNRGDRLILRGPNGAGKSTLLKALAGSLAPRAGERRADERLRLGVFAQDLAQELPQDANALEYVADAVRVADASITDEACRNTMAALGLVGDKALRRIGALSGGEKARVALATFCLTPCNLILLDEPTNHLDVAAIGALLEAIDQFTGAVVVSSHDRPFCEAIRCSHVGYVSGGSVTVEQRSLRDSDFSVDDSGVANTEAGAAAGNGAAHKSSKAEREAERKLQKERGAAPKKIKTIEGKIEKAEEKIAALDDELLAAGNDSQRCIELSAEQATLQEELEALYEEYERLETLLAEPVK